MEKIIEVYKLKHGDKYDYSQSDFTKLKIKIECPKHGIFEQNKYSHKNYGCWTCSVEERSNSQKMKKGEFQEKSKIIHGNKYEYDLVDYQNNRKKVIIVCKKHGQFRQLPSSHLAGNGCRKCGSESTAKQQSNTKEIFIEKSKKIHKDKYDYTLVEYINQKNKVKIICKSHGLFEQLPNNHLKGYGCPKCVGKFMSTQEFIDKVKKIHSDKYDYSLVEYKNSLDKIKIICKKHGIFLQSASNHLNQKNGCPTCYEKNHKSNTSKFIEKSMLIHGLRYGYNQVDYFNAKTPVLIICKKHGKFTQQPTHHLSGKGCPICKSSKGEIKIHKILSEKKIEFEHHYRLENNLEFDFFIPSIKIAIEFDGIQHFKPVKHFGGKKAFIDQKKRDETKNKYCEDKDIFLIRIPYTEEDIQSVLDIQLFNRREYLFINS